MLKITFLLLRKYKELQKKPKQQNNFRKWVLLKKSRIRFYTTLSRPIKSLLPTTKSKIMNQITVTIFWLLILPPLFRLKNTWCLDSWFLVLKIWHFKVLKDLIDQRKSMFASIFLRFKLSARKAWMSMSWRGTTNLLMLNWYQSRYPRSLLLFSLSYKPQRNSSYPKMQSKWFYYLF